MFSIATVLPFLTVVIEPEKIWKIEIVKSTAQWLGLKTAASLITPIALLFGLVNYRQCRAEIVEFMDWRQSISANRK